MLDEVFDKNNYSVSFHTSDKMNKCQKDSVLFLVLKNKLNLLMFSKLLIVALIFFLQPVGSSHQKGNLDLFQLYKLMDLANLKSS